MGGWFLLAPILCQQTGILFAGFGPFALAFRPTTHLFRIRQTDKPTLCISSTNQAQLIPSRRLGHQLDLAYFLSLLHLVYLTAQVDKTKRIVCQLTQVDGLFSRPIGDREAIYGYINPGIQGFYRSSPAFLLPLSGQESLRTPDDLACEFVHSSFSSLSQAQAVAFLNLSTSKLVAWGRKYGFWLAGNGRIMSFYCNEEVAYLRARFVHLGVGSVYFLISVA